MNSARKKITPTAIRELKKARKKIVVLTAADFITARLLDESAVDMILVGDSLGTTLLGYPSTVSVTLREMLHHIKAVARARPSALLVADMPFGSYHQSKEQAVRNAVRLIREGGADAIKLEGGVAQEENIRAIVQAGIPVMAHIGLQPQSVLHEGYRVQGKTPSSVQALKKDLKAVEGAGAFSCIFEYIQATTAKTLTKLSSIPTIGIGSGPHCDGQVLVTSDLLGLQSWLTPKAARQYAQLGKEMKKAFEKYSDDVRKGKFPTMKESF
jgi:3-methyl-2-oxobutanoate hydroxymethyltransferase